MADDTGVGEAEACRAEGNELLGRGLLAEAVQCYDRGLVALLQCQCRDASAAGAAPARVAALRAALHLNASLAHLRRGNLGSAVDHASGALASERSAKAFYRRGLARRRLAELASASASLASLAKEDFEAALQLEPQNAEVRAQLQQLKEPKAQSDSELDGKKIFSKELYEAPKPVLRESQGKNKRLLLSTDALTFDYASEPVLKGVNIELREGWCLGLVGLNAAGKTTLARIMRGQLRPSSGTVQHHGAGSDPPPAFTFAQVSMALAIVVLAVSFAAAHDTRAAVGLSASVMVAFVVWFSCFRKSSTQQLVLHLSSEASDKESIPPSRTIESVIADEFPKLPHPERRKVIKMLEAAGFQMYNQETGEPVGCPEDYIRDGVQYGHLSGGQKHLIYILRYFARCISAARGGSVILACDELLGGLDSIRQPRVLRMLKRMQAELCLGILYITTELHQIHIVADDLAFLHDGHICEVGAAGGILEFPRHAATKDYVSQFRSLPGGQRLGGKLRDSYEKLAGDAALEAWL